jgi:hypothetical protein
MHPMLSQEAAGIAELADFAIPAPRVSPIRAFWGLSQVILACLLAAYLVGWIQDFQRVSQLSAEALHPTKKVVISKWEAWDRVYRR